MTRTILPFDVTVRRIIHLADIHVRLFKRHEEYRECFETLYKTLEATDLTDTVIVVAGDIAHTKLDLSPEMVGLISEFLGTLARLAPTLVIAGNHDLNVANMNRMDALTPIISNISEPHLKYLKHSGIYAIGDTDFYVWSIIGEQADWPSPDTSSRTKICLFHGPVHNAQTDVGYTVTNRHVMIESFDGFDMVILGDIHKHQVLQGYDPTNKKPIIVYSSSLIQQNHGEAFRGHGYCDWDVASRSFTFHELPNRYGYYTLRVENGVVPDYSDMPRTVRLRIFAGSLEPSEIKKLVTKIREKHDVRELAISSYEGAKKNVQGPAIGTVLDITDINYQNRLITEWLQDAMPSLEPDVLDRVLRLNKEKNEEIATDDLAKKIVWKPLSLEFDNLFTYGEGNVIQFDQLGGVIGIFAPNASGKTSIAEAICFALYDRTPRTAKAANIMNTRKTSCRLKFRFEIDGQEFVVERKGTKNKKGEVKIDVDFYRIENGNKISLNGEERRYTNENIKSYVGDFDSFLLTTFSSSSQAGLFVDKGQSDRKDLLSQFMGLNIFEKLYFRASDESKEVKGALAQFKNDDFTQSLVDTQTQLDHVGWEKSEKEIELEEVNEKLNVLTKEIQNLYEKKTPIEPVRTDVELDLVENRLKVQEQTIRAALKDSSEKQSVLKDQLVVASDKIADRSKIEEEYKKHQQSKVEKDRLVMHQGIWTKKLDSARKELTQLERYQYDPNCAFCIQNGKSTISAIESTKNSIGECEQKIKEYSEQIVAIDHELQASVGIEETYKKYVEMGAWIASAEKRLTGLVSEIAKLNMDLAPIQSQYVLIEAERKKFADLQQRIEENKQLDSLIANIETDKRTEKAKFTTISATIQSLASQMAVLEQKKHDMLNRIREAEELESKYEAYEAYLAVTHRDGLPYKMIAEIIPALEVAVNNILSQMVEFNLIFEMDGKNVNMKIAYDDTKIWPLELASGMEKFISSLAIRVALTGLSALPKSNFLIVDEGLGVLDADNMSSISMLFDVLKSQFEFVLLISHVDAARDVADSLWEITRTDGFSKIHS